MLLDYKCLVPAEKSHGPGQLLGLGSRDAKTQPRCKEAETRAAQEVGGVNLGTQSLPSRAQGTLAKTCGVAPRPCGKEKHPSLLRLELPSCFARRQA